MQIGIFKGEFQYGAVNVFADHLGAACARAGVRPVEIDLTQDDAVTVPVIRWLASQPGTLGFLGFNGIAVHQEQGAQLVRIGQDRPYAAWFVDHPIMHLPRIARMPQDLLLTVDAGHAAFLGELGLPHVKFLPHAGCKDATGGPHATPWRERALRLFMPGSIGNPDALRSSVIASLQGSTGPGWAALYCRLLECDVSDDRGLLALALREAEGMGLGEGLSGPLCVVVTQAIMTARHRHRLDVLQALDRLGLGVDLAGHGCEQFTFRHHRVHPVTDMCGTVQRFREARFVLHINPLFSEAMHERAAYAAMAGAAVVTDGNRMLKRELAGGRGVVFEPDDVGALGERLERLEQTGEGAAIAAKGQRLMADRHTWDHRAAILIEALKAQSDGRPMQRPTLTSGPARRTG